MVYPNGRLPGSLLTDVEPGTPLLRRDAPVYYAFRMWAQDRGRTLRVAQPAGGYRSYAVQAAMHQAGSKTGTAAQRRRWGLNPYSTVAIAAAGYSTHGRTDHARLDLVGTDLTWIVANLARFGMRREFGANDPNHVEVSQPAAARWRHTVPATKVTLTGRVGGVGSAFRRRVQLFARLGGYDGPVDGDEGTNTWAGVDSELKVNHWGSGVTGLQVWAGVRRGDARPGKSGDHDWTGVPAGNVRKVAAKLNRL